MLDVLLSAAAPGQTRPSPADTADLLLGAARIRLRHATAGIGGSPWTDALSITGFLATLLLVAEAVRFAVNVPQLARSLADHGSLTPEYSLVYEFGTGPFWLLWTAIAVLAWRGLRRPATVTASAATAVHAFLAVYGTAYPHGPGATVGESLSGVPLLLALAATASLLASPGPLHGARLLGRKRVAAASALAALLVALYSLPLFTLALPDHHGSLDAARNPGLSAYVLGWGRAALATVAAGVVLTAAALARTRGGRRAFALLIPAVTPIFPPYVLFTTAEGDTLVLPDLLAKGLAAFALTMLCVRLAELSTSRARGERAPA